MIVNLEATTSLAITLNTTHQSFAFHKKKVSIPSKIFDVRLDDFRNILLNPIIEYPTHVYTEYRDVYAVNTRSQFESMGIRHNIIFIPNSMLGIEFPKTHVYTSIHPKEDNKNLIKKLTAKHKKQIPEMKFASILECLTGGCAILFQHRKLDEDYVDKSHSLVEVYESGIVKLKKGERMVIPVGYDYVIVNTKSSPLIISKLFKKDFMLNYSNVSDCKGFGYYVIRKNGRIEIVPNSMYRNSSKLRLVKHKDLAKDYKLDYKLSTYKYFLSHSEFFKEILEDF